ncbi:putative glutamine repeat protein-1 protein [Golovinomyces cichoracearum]|uniref:Putative glutamine repeat protein-1 protein n=1 Tax=Golovinomyces cichoracearum TaxID=62708 RepID=A0A420I5F2_9PEZI|nr:putative glutamine repeat protein-1 protein [Golovinomyces cichoracearum]
MYAPNFGYGSGNAFNTNACLPPQVQVQAHTPHQQQQQQQQQHVIYSSQQYADQVPPQQPSLYGPVGNTSAMGMGSNSGMVHMGSGNAFPSYQTPYSRSPYSGGLSTPTTSVIPNFTPGSSAPSAYGMNVSSTSPQNQTPRLQPSSNSSTPTQYNSRASSFSNGQYRSTQNTPNVQSQFQTSQNHNQQLPAPINIQKTQPVIPLTPQAPNFPAGIQSTPGASAVTVPLSPDSEAREKERVTVLLNINKELILEVMDLQAAQQDIKDEASGGPNGGFEKEKARGSISSRYYFECMRRLQANLAYLAARADRNKPSSQIPTHPQVMFAPPISPRLSQNKISIATSPMSDCKREVEEKQSDVERERLETIKEYYRKLQALFPGIDPRKESFPNPMARTQQPQKQNAVDTNFQQKMQNDVRLKMMKAQQNQQQYLHHQ